MSSQDTMSWVRHQITERKSLQQICEDCMTRCLSPDSDVAGGVGCDNMTILIVALLHGRTLDQWYDWIIDRVEKKVGYDTPRSFGPLYSASRYAHAAAVRSGLGEDSPGHTPLLRPSGLWNRFNSPLHLGNSFTGGGLGAGNDVEPDDEEDFEDSGDELMDESPEESLHAILRNAGLNGVISGPVRLHAPPQRDQTSSLRAQLHELDEDRGGQEGDGALVEDDLSQASSDDQSPVLNIASNTITNRQPTSIGSPLIAAPPSLKDMRSPITPNNEQGGPQSPRKSSLPPGANPGNQS
ncbi:uncharacterized protein EI90DRAFT_1857937 [Cantharellus anzutake]|uniref:uncharacterized protein n=1 Tax=Cantharellus anzutake TaxID=1750568 RepID=UPI0019070B78|nr:uncharacterized protein EI90DRAFT_1857937 [Cantharellus anzutake]KAF8327022.1 hypothetical protein EI90DRAFT_1857937 [Cantharellus anzutake]